jgi:hypothetical protein
VIHGCRGVGPVGCGRLPDEAIRLANGIISSKPPLSRTARIFLRLG